MTIHNNDSSLLLYSNVGSTLNLTVIVRGICGEVYERACLVVPGEEEQMRPVRAGYT